MNDFFKRNEYIIKQKVQPFKSNKTIIIVDPTSKEEIASIKTIILEEGGFFSAGRHALGIFSPEEKSIVTIGQIEAMGGSAERNDEKKIRNLVGILDENDDIVGKFYSKNLLGATWYIEDADDAPIGELKVGITGDKVIDQKGDEALKIGAGAAGFLRESMTKAKSYKLKMLKDVSEKEKILFVTAAILYQIICHYRVNVW